MEQEGAGKQEGPCGSGKGWGETGSSRLEQEEAGVKHERHRLEQEGTGLNRQGQVRAERGRGVTGNGRLQQEEAA